MNFNGKDEKENILNPPDDIIGMKDFDLKKFEKKINLRCLRANSKDLQKIIKIIKPYILKKQNFQSVTKEDENFSLVHLNPMNCEELLNNEKFDDLKKNYPIELTQKTIMLNYENFNYTEIINTILKDENLKLSSFSTIGHIIHLNLKENYKPFQSIIGKILLDKNPNQKIVINKIDKIDSIYRNFNFEVLAKKDDNVNTEVIVKENGFIFKMDFSKVYWNPRLSTEHERIISFLNKSDVVYDVFAGIGPFAIPAAVNKNCIVLANDLNIESYNSLKENIKLNKVKNIEAYNLDGRDFINQILKENLKKNWLESKKNEMKKKFHIIMNLPGLAIEFLDEFVSLFNENEKNEILIDCHLNDLEMPTVYCYCFHETEKDNKLIEERVKNKIGYENLKIESITFVRKVAPKKDMFRIKFKIPYEIIFSENKFKKIRTQ